jgi:predicted nuclease of predicted toxin-antitoxin system
MTRTGGKTATASQRATDTRRRAGRRILLVLALALLVVPALSGSALASGPFAITQITINNVWDSPPLVSGDRVVWYGEGGSDAGGDYEVFTWTPAGGTVQLTTNSYQDYKPQVSGDRVVWYGLGGSDAGTDTEIFTWTPGDGTVQLTTDDYLEWYPHVSGDRVVWQGDGGSDAGTDFEIITWTPGDGPVQLTINSNNDTYPRVDGDRVVWDGTGGSDAGSDWEVFTWTPGGGAVQLTANSQSDQLAEVSGDRVVWDGTGGSGAAADYEIFTWTPGEGLVQVTNDSDTDINPQVSGDRVAWYGQGGSDRGLDWEAFTAVPAFSVIYTSIRGTDRYDTAIKISQALFPAALPAGSGLVLAPGETFPEALCGAPLAAAWGGPVLLTYQAALANNVRAELQRLAPAQVYCIGLSTTAVDAVVAALPAATVTPITGADVYDMSSSVANALAAKVGTGTMPDATAIITVGTNFPDAIGVSPLACSKLWPIFLTDKADGSAVHPSTAEALANLDITKALKVGTYAALPDGVTGVANLSGTDRYYTDANVATWSIANAGLTFTHTGFATGDKFPDALASGPYLAKDDGILLLSPLNGPLPAVIAGVIITNAAAVQHVTFIACIEPVIEQVKALLP